MPTLLHIFSLPVGIPPSFSQSPGAVSAVAQQAGSIPHTIKERGGRTQVCLFFSDSHRATGQQQPFLLTSLVSFLPPFKVFVVRFQKGFQGEASGYIVGKSERRS